MILGSVPGLGKIELVISKKESNSNQANSANPTNNSPSGSSPNSSRKTKVDRRYSEPNLTYGKKVNLTPSSTQETKNRRLSKSEGHSPSTPTKYNFLRRKRFCNHFQSPSADSSAKKYRSQEGQILRPSLTNSQIYHLLKFKPYEIYQIMTIYSEDLERSLFLSRLPTLHKKCLVTLKRLQIQTIISLLEPEEIKGINFYTDQEIYQRHGIAYINFAIPDMGVPEMTQAQKYIPYFAQILMYQNVLIHCLAGRGRSGTICACILIHYGYSAQESVKIVRHHRTGAITTPKQENFIYDYEQFVEGERLQFCH